MSLSGGQRQRLSLARAILAAPKILVLDDTLSALDMHTEAVVDRGAGPGAALGDRHRRRAPRVHRAAGRQGGADRPATATITHVGTHAELLADVPQYRYLLAADDELDDGAERSCAWEDDEDRDAPRPRLRGAGGPDTPATSGS